MLSKTISKMRRLLKFYLQDKQYSEYDFWRKEVEKRVKWYNGQIENLLDHPCPDENFKVKGFSLRENAIRTFIKANFSKYPKKLNLPANRFAGKKVLDIGCGPNPWIAAFTDCDAYGLDQLINEYRKLGFPMERFSQRLTYLKGGAENIPAKDNFFDAVISVNAIDHVDNFAKAASEIKRVLKPNGEIRLEVHYHKSTVCEPWELNDSVMLKNFGDIGIKKLSQTTFEGRTGTETITIWGNRE